MKNLTQWSNLFSTELKFEISLYKPRYNLFYFSAGFLLLLLVVLRQYLPVFSAFAVWLISAYLVYLFVLIFRFTSIHLKHSNRTSFLTHAKQNIVSTLILAKEGDAFYGAQTIFQSKSQPIPRHKPQHKSSDEHSNANTKRLVDGQSVANHAQNNSQPLSEYQYSNESEDNYTVVELGQLDSRSRISFVGCWLFFSRSHKTKADGKATDIMNMMTSAEEQATTLAKTTRLAKTASLDKTKAIFIAKNCLSQNDYAKLRRIILAIK